jgi:hypothetical protein
VPDVRDVGVCEGFCDGFCVPVVFSGWVLAGFVVVAEVVVVGVGGVMAGGVTTGCGVGTGAGLVAVRVGGIAASMPPILPIRLAACWRRNSRVSRVG